MDWYRDGQEWVAVWTGMPEDHVCIGVGSTLGNARKNMQGTPMQSVGRDGGLRKALEWAHYAGWIDCPPSGLEDADQPEDEP